MNVRAIVLVLALFSLVSTATGGYLYYHSAKESAVKEAEVDLVAKSQLLNDRIVNLISANHMEARALALFEELQEALIRPNRETLAQANRVLDHFSDGQDGEVSYLVDNAGNTIASSNRQEPESFVGKNYAFRPYFQEAIQGTASTYMALGVTSDLRGVYFSYPVYVAGGNKPIGVAVIKASVKTLERGLSQANGGIALLVHDSGMIFASSRKDWVLNLLWRASPEELSQIAQTQQFGKGPWKWTGLERRSDNQAEDRSGEFYKTVEMNLENCPGWRTVHLQSVAVMSGKLVDPLIGWTGYAALILFVLVAGAVLVLYGMAQRDIHSRKRAEEVLRTERSKFETLAENAPFGMAMISSGGRFQYVNTSFKKMFGYDLSDIPTGKDWLRKAYPDADYRHEVIAAWIGDLDSSGLGEQRPRIFTVTCKDMTRKVIHFRPVQLAPAEHLMTCEDITERWQAEERLRQSEEEFRRIIERLQDLFYRADMDGTLTFLSPASERVTGYKPEEGVGRNIGEFYLDASERQEFMRLILENGFVNDFEARLVHKNGGVVWVSVSSRLYKDKDGNIDGVEGIARDISDRKSMEKALRESEQMFRLLSEQSLLSVAILQNGVYCYVNEAASHLLEYSVQEILNWPPDGFLDVVHPDERSLVRRQASMKQVGDPDQLPHYSFRIITKSGTTKWVEIYSKTIQFDGSPANLITMLDISERRRAEEDRSLYAQRLEALIQLGHMRDAPLNELAAFAMEEAVRLTGSSIGYVAFANEDETELTMHAWSQEAMRQCAMAEKPLVYPVTHTGLWGEALRQRRPIITNDYAAPNPWKKGTPEGHVQILRHMNVPILDDDRIVIVAGVGNKHEDYDENDVKQLTLLMEGMWRIVRHKRAEEALQESEERFRTAFQTSPDSVNINRLSDGLYVDVNTGFTELTGFTRDEVIGRSSLEINIWHDSGDRDLLVAGLKERGYVRNLEAQFRLKDGRVRTALMSARIILIHGEPHILSVTRDVDDWKKAEEALRDSEATLRTLLQAAPIGIGQVSADRTLGWTNHLLCTMLGYSREELAGKSARILYENEEEFLRVGREKHPDVIRSGTGSVETSFQRKDGTTFDVLLSSSSVFPGDLSHGMVFTAMDITERQRSEQQLKRLGAAVESAGETIVVTDPAGSIIYVNPTFEEITGYSRQEAQGKNPRILKSGKHDQAFYREMWDTLLAGQVWRGRLTNKKKDGTLYEETATISPIKDKSGRTVNYVAVKRDVTGEAMLQKQLLHAQKMEAIGTLAGGIAHDFNNLLQAILGYTDLLLMRKDRGDPDRQKLEIIHRAARDGADLVSRILTFSRKAEAKARPIDLNEEIYRVENLLRRTVPKMIKIKLALADGLRIIDADPAQIEQLLLNLAVNAQHAMRDGGDLLIETSNVSLSDEYLRAHLGTQLGHYVLLTVSDTGVGIEPDALDRIFEPFFTTKTNGEGTGLGLSMVHGIVSQHGGHITCYSEPGRGTSFKIYFPVSAGELMSDLTLTREMPAFGTETVLLVDDDDRIREMGRQMIEIGGYSVIVARSGEEALELYAAHKDDLSLVILDLIMPGMGGKKCLEQLLRIDPNVKVLVASGYSSDGVKHDQKLEAAKGFIGKPYDAKDILGAIRKVLDLGEL